MLYVYGLAAPSGECRVSATPKAAMLLSPGVPSAQLRREAVLLLLGGGAARGLYGDAGCGRGQRAAVAAGRGEGGRRQRDRNAGRAAGRYRHLARAGGEQARRSGLVVRAS